MSATIKTDTVAMSNILSAWRADDADINAMISEVYSSFAKIENGWVSDGGELFRNENASLLKRFSAVSEQMRVLQRNLKQTIENYSGAENRQLSSTDSLLSDVIK